MVQSNKEFYRQKAQDKETRQIACDVYDKDGTFCSLVGKCTFCGIIYKDDPQIILYKDEHTVIFRDRREKGEAHYQCIPRRHIMNFTKLRLA